MLSSGQEPFYLQLREEFVNDSKTVEIIHNLSQVQELATCSRDHYKCRLDHRELTSTAR